MAKRRLRNLNNLSRHQLNELRAEVTHDIAIGFSPRETADKHGVPHYFAWECKRIYEGMRSDSEAVVHMTVAMLDGTREQMDAIRDVVTDITWLKKQKAGDLARLHDTLSDKYFKILGAFVAGREDDSHNQIEQGNDGRSDGRGIPQNAGDRTTPVETDDVLPVPADPEHASGTLQPPPSPQPFIPRNFMA